MSNRKSKKARFVPPPGFLVEEFDFCQRGTIATIEVLLLAYSCLVQNIVGFAYYEDTYHPFTNKPISCLEYLAYEVKGFTLDECRVVRRFKRADTMISAGTIKCPFYVTSFTVEGTKKEAALGLAASLVTIENS